MLLLFYLSTAGLIQLETTILDPELSIRDAETTLKAYKNMILEATTQSDEIIFVGNTASYFYYLFNANDERNCYLVPISFSRYHTERIVWKEASRLLEAAPTLKEREKYDAHYSQQLRTNLSFVENLMKKNNIPTIDKLTKGFCESIIDPLRFELQQDIAESTHNATREQINISDGRIVLVDFSLTGQSIYGFLRLIKSCVAKTYDPRSISESITLKRPVVFLNILGTKHLGWKALLWEHNVGVSEIKDLVVPGDDAFCVVEYLRRAEKYNVPRLLPVYSPEQWKSNQSESQAFIEVFQRSKQVRHLISTLRQIGMGYKTGKRKYVSDAVPVDEADKSKKLKAWIQKFIKAER